MMQNADQKEKQTHKRGSTIDRPRNRQTNNLRARKEWSLTSGGFPVTERERGRGANLGSAQARTVEEGTAKRA